MADERLHLQLLGHLQDEGELGHLLHGDDHLAAGLPGQEGHADEGLVLVAVAEDQRLGVQVHAEGDHQLGLGAGLQAVVVLVPGPDDLVHHLLDLVGLDGVDALVAPFVAELDDGAAEGLVHLHHPVVEHLGEAQVQETLGVVERSRLHELAGAVVGGDAPGFLAVLDDLVDIAGERFVLGGGDLQVALGIDAEVAVAPLLDAVQRGGVLDGPVLHGHPRGLLNRGGHLWPEFRL